MARRRGSPWWESVLFCAGPDETCWEWTAARSSTGYGHMKVGDRTVALHIIVYEQFRGDVPDGLELDHLCRNRACCNPAHLEAVTRTVNQVRGDTPAGRVSRTGLCKHGHELTGSNVYVAPKNGDRSCMTCRQAAEVRRQNKRRSARGRSTS